jgi:hypothetical protein
MKKESNVISMKEVKSWKKQTIEEREDEWRKTKEEIRERLSKRDYIITFTQTGEERMSSFDYERQVESRRCYQVCSLEEIPKYIEYMKNGYWVPREKGLSKEELDNYPHEKKKWGVYEKIIIEPLSKELEDSYIDPKSRKFFQSWREIRDDDENTEQLHLESKIRKYRKKTSE